MERGRREMSEIIGLRRRALEEWFWHATLKYRRGPFSGAARPRCKRAQVPRAWIRELIGRSRRFSWAEGCAPSSRTACRSSIFRSCEVQGLTWGEDSSHGGRPARSLRPGPPYSAPGQKLAKKTYRECPHNICGPVDMSNSRSRSPMCSFTRSSHRLLQYTYTYNRYK